MFQPLLLGIIGYANAHGMLYYAGPMPSHDSKGAVRDYNLLNSQIDSLRNPIAHPKLCRGAAPRPPIPIHLSNNEDFEVTFAFSVGAQHIGPCTIEILDADDLSKPGIVIASAASEAGCAVKPIAQFNTDKGSPASNQCPGKVPAGLVTNDMCLNTWTFKPINVDKIYCKKCVLRWTWDAHHISKNTPEKYENCIDVTINGSSNVVAASHSESSSKSSDSGVILPPSLRTESKSSLNVNSADQPNERQVHEKILPQSLKVETKTTSEVSADIKSVQHFAKSADQEPSPVFVSNSAIQQPSSISSANRHDCKCDLSTDASIYTQCTSDGNYCTCFSGAWSSLGKLKSKCAPGTSCKQIGSQIMCS